MIHLNKTAPGNSDNKNASWLLLSETVPETDLFIVGGWMEKINKRNKIPTNNGHFCFSAPNLHFVFVMLKCN